MLLMSKFVHFFIILQCISLTKVASEKTNRFNFNQNDYKCKPERAEVVNYDKRYFRYLKIATFKHNRTCTAFNISVNYKINFGHDMEVVVQCYKFLSNEYRYFPLRFQINLCIALNSNVLGAFGINKCGNLVGCPLLKDRDYLVCNFVPDVEKLPPLIPSGRYMVELVGMYSSTEIWTARMYGEVYRPIV